MTTLRKWRCPVCRAEDTKDPGQHYEAYDDAAPPCPGRSVEVYICPVSEARHGWLNKARTNPEPQGQWQVNSHRRQDGHHVDRGGGYWPTTPCIVIPERSDA